MSESTPEARPGSKAAGKKYAGLSRNQWLIVGGVFVGVLGYLLWKRHQASQQASQQAATNVGSNECADQNGNPVDCNELFASELAALQNSLDQLGAQSAGGGGGTSGGGGTTGTGDGGGGGTTGSGGSGGGTTGSGGGGGGTGTKTKPKTAGAITGLKVKPGSITKSSFTAEWNPASNAHGYAYIVRDLATHTQTTKGQTNSTSVTVSGLKSRIDYNFGIQALPGGAGDNIHVRTK